jgi:hypothetical protein
LGQTGGGDRRFQFKASLGKKVRAPISKNQLGVVVQACNSSSTGRWENHKASPRQKLQDHICKTTKAKRAGGMALKW